MSPTNYPPPTMNTIAATSVVTPPKRQRQDFDAVAILELAQSIEKNGLLHAIVVQTDGKTLIAGERRLRAILTHLIPFGKCVTYNGAPLPPGMIPTVKTDKIDSLALEEIELAENIHRRDLSWQELATTHARLHALRQAQAVIARDDGLAIPAEILHTIADTAREVFPAETAALDIEGSPLGGYHETIRKEVIVAANMHLPEVAKAANLKDAFKALKRAEDAERTRNLAAIVGRTHDSSVHRLFHGDCLELMRRWEEDPVGPRFDVILTDPPYGMNAQDFNDAGGMMEGISHTYDDSPTHWHKMMPDWCRLAYNVAKPRAHAYVFCDIEMFSALKDYMRNAGWYVFRTPLTNFKQNSGRVPLPDKGPRRQSEWCLYAIKGDKLTNYIASDVIVTGSDDQKLHGAQKPVALYDDLLRRSVQAGHVCLDSFAGTGPLIPAAHALKCVAYCIEQNAADYGKCVERVLALDTAQGELPNV